LSASITAGAQTKVAVRRSSAFSSQARARCSAVGGASSLGFSGFVVVVAGGLRDEFLVGLLRALAHGLQFFARDQRLHRVGALVVPVAVEAARQVLHDRAGRQHVDVDEVARGRIAEVGVAQVAPARDAEHVVGQEQLVVHALLDARGVVDGVEQAAEGGVARAGQRVEQPHLDVRDEGQAQHQRVAPGGVEVVEQHAHAHAAFGRRAQPAHEAAGAGVGVDGVVLQVQRLLGALDQREPAAVGGLRAAQQQEAGFVARLVGLAALLHQVGQRGAGGRRGDRGETGRSTFCGSCAQAPRITSARSAADRRNNVWKEGRACGVPAARTGAWRGKPHV
jgi:hypothetical protein